MTLQLHWLMNISRQQIILTLSETWMRGAFWRPPPSFPTSYTLIKICFIGLACWVSFIPIKLIFTRSGQIWMKFLQRVMRYDLFVEKRYNILRICDTYNKWYTCILLKSRCICHINNLSLIPDLSVKFLMKCLWRHYWPHEVLMTSLLAFIWTN